MAVERGCGRAGKMRRETAEKAAGPAPVSAEDHHNSLKWKERRPARRFHAAA
jgi:hypothetical protein